MGDDDDNEKKVPSLDKSSSTPSMTQMYSQQLEQQRNALKYHDPYGARAIKLQSKMDEVLNDSSLPEDVKSLRYNDLLQDYKFAMEKKYTIYQSFTKSTCAPKCSCYKNS